MQRERSHSCVILLVITILTGCFLASEARAQPGPAAAADDTDQRRRYDEAFSALLAGQLDAAAAQFDTVARDARDPELRAAARELARFARAALARQSGAGTTSSPAQQASADSIEGEEDRTAGRTSFVISTTLASVYGGAVLIDLTDVDSFRPAIALILGSTAVGFAGSYFGSQGRHITEAMSDAYSLGLGLGVGNSLLLAGPLDLYDSSEHVQTLNVAAMALGGGTGLVLARAANPTRGQVSVASLGSLLGIASVGLGLAIIQPDVDDGGDSVLLLLAGGLDGGTLAGMTLGRKLDWSLSRARLVGLGTFLGALAGFGVPALATGIEDADDSTARIWATSTLLGMWGGTLLTSYLTRDMSPDRRYRGQTRSWAVAPMPLRGGMGLSLGGQL